MQVEIQGYSLESNIQTAHKRHSCARAETPVRNGKHQIPTSELDKGNIQRQITFSERNPNRWKNGRCPNAPPCGQMSTEWNEEQEEFARHRAHKLHKKLFKTKGHNKDVQKTKLLQK